MPPNENREPGVPEWLDALGKVYDRMSDIKDALAEKINDVAKTLGTLQADVRTIPRYSRPCESIVDVERRLAILEDRVHSHHATAEQDEIMNRTGHLKLRVALIVAVASAGMGWLMVAVEFYLRHKALTGG